MGFGPERNLSVANDGEERKVKSEKKGEGSPRGKNIEREEWVAVATKKKLMRNGTLALI